MKKKITGYEYSYIIELLKQGKNYCFQILCLHESTFRKSRITNLNYILAEVVAPVMNYEQVEDSWVEVSRKKGERLFSTAIDCFKDKRWIQNLEDKLDEDRSCGEWEANFEF